MRRSALLMLAAIVLLNAPSGFCREDVLSLGEDDDSASKAQLQVDVADSIVALQLTVKARTARDEARVEPRAPRCSWPMLGDASDEVVDGAETLAFDAEHALPEDFMGPQSTKDDDYVMLLHSDVAVKSKAARAEARREPRVPRCFWPISDDAAGQLADDADQAIDAGHALFEAPAEAQSKQPPSESPMGILRGFVFLMTLAVVAGGAWHWQLQGRDAAPHHATKPQSKRSALAPEPVRNCYPWPDHAVFWELSQAALEGSAAQCEAVLNSAEAHAGGNSLEALVCADQTGCTAMHAAARGGAVPVLELLLKRRAQVDPVDRWDETPLHFAAREGHADACALLIASGATLQAPNAQDRTPLAVAGHAGKDVVCNRLLDLGAHAGDQSEEDLPPLVAELIAARMLVGDGSEEE